MPETYKIRYLGARNPDYVFGKTKVHPAPPEQQSQPPSLDPKVAPWSAPRGYTTSLAEEARDLKRRQQSNKPAVLVASKHYKRPAVPVNKEKARVYQWATRTKNHFAAVMADIRAPGFFHRLIGVCCCIRVDVEAALAPPSAP